MLASPRLASPRLASPSLFWAQLFLWLVVFSLGARAEDKARPAHWATPLGGDFNLYRMDGNLYRSARPDTDDVAQLKALGIVTVVNFYQESDTNWITGSGMQEIHLPMRMRSFDDEDAIAALRDIRSAQKKGAVLIHCRHGQNRTGLVAALYRVIYQGWSKEQALAEMRGGFGDRGMKHGIRYLQEVDVNAVKQALENGECSTDKLAWCQLKSWLQR